MNVKQSAIAFAIAAALPLAAQAAPKVSFAAPLAGGSLSGNVYQNNRCEVKGSNDIRRVVFWLDGSTQLNTEGSAPWNCNVDTTKYYDGAHRLRAVAYDSRGASTATEITVNFSNNNPAPSTGGTSGGTTSPTYSYSGTPYGSAPFAAPMAFPAVAFDRGGQAVAYNDRTSGNSGGQLRTSESVDIVAFSDPISPYTVNSFQTGEWLAYSVNVPTTGKYDLAIRAAHNYAATPAFHIEVDGVNVTGSISVPETGGWSTYQWFGKQGIDLAAGKRIIKVVSEAEYFNMNGVSVLASASTGGGTTTPTEPTGGTTTPSGLSVAFDSPKTGDTISTVLNQSTGCQVSGSGIARVEFSLDTAALNNEGSAPWQCNLDPKLFPVGTHKLKAKAFNSSGASVETTVDVNTTGGSTGSTGGGSTGGSTGTPPAGMMFWSGFDGVTPGTPFDCYSNGCYQTLDGTDARTGFAWPPQVSNSSGKFQLLVNGPTPTPTTVYNYMRNEIHTVTGPKGAQAQALYSRISESGCCGTQPQGSHSTQNPYILFPTSDVPTMYLSYWIKFQPDLKEKLHAGDAWRPVFEFKTAGDDYRFMVSINAYGGLEPYWDVGADTYSPTRVTHFRTNTNGRLTVPADRWMKMEIYWKRSTGSDGRFWVAVDGEVIADRYGANMGPNRAPINRIMMSQLYSGSAYPIYQWVTDVQMWSTFPTVSSGAAWYNPPYASH
jgi:hypothetical protein